MTGTDGATLAVHHNGHNGKPVLLHGGPGVPDYMQPAFAPLLTDMHCGSFDQRGTGASTCTNGHCAIAGYLNDIEAIRKHSNYPSWHVIGHCWGPAARPVLRSPPPRSGRQSRTGQFLAGVAAITDGVLEEVRAWQNRVLDPVWPVVFLDAIMVKVRDNRVVTSKPAYLGLGDQLANQIGIKRPSSSALIVASRMKNP